MKLLSALLLPFLIIFSACNTKKIRDQAGDELLAIALTEAEKAAGWY